MLKRKALKKYRIACIETFLCFARNCGCNLRATAISPVAGTMKAPSCKPKA
jgi:hypothetical protein